MVPGLAFKDVHNPSFTHRLPCTAQNHSCSSINPATETFRKSWNFSVGEMDVTYVRWHSHTSCEQCQTRTNQHHLGTRGAAPHLYRTVGDVGNAHKGPFLPKFHWGILFLDRPRMKRYQPGCVNFLALNFRCSRRLEASTSHAYPVGCIGAFLALERASISPGILKLGCCALDPPLEL